MQLDHVVDGDTSGGKSSLQMPWGMSNIGECQASRKAVSMDNWRPNSLPDFPPRPCLYSNPVGEVLLLPGAAGGKLTRLGHATALRTELSAGQQKGRQKKLLRLRP